MHNNKLCTTLGQHPLYQTFLRNMWSLQHKVVPVHTDRVAGLDWHRTHKETTHFLVATEIDRFEAETGPSNNIDPISANSPLKRARAEYFFA